MFVIMRIFSFTQKDMNFCRNRLIIESMKEQIDEY